MRLVNIKNENIFNQARRNGLESYQRFQGREDIELNAAGIAQAVRCGQTLQGLGIEAVVYKPTETCTLHRGGDCCTDRVKQRRCRADAGAD